MRKPLMTAACAATGLSLFASAPQVTDVTVANAPYAPEASVSYRLSGEPGVVTFELWTNGVPVDCGYVTVAGDVNRLLQPRTEPYTFTWSSQTDWPNHKDKKVETRVVVKAWSTNAPPDYMIVPLKNAATEPVRYYAKAGDIPGGVTNIVYKTDYLPMRLIHARGETCILGMRYGETEWYAARGERPVSFTNDFYLAVYELTQAQYATIQKTGTTLITYANAVWKNDAARYKEFTAPDTDYGRARAVGGPTPKYYVVGSTYSWPETFNVQANLPIGNLRTLTGIPTFHLPTGAEWEFACRAGTLSPFNDGTKSIADVGWCTANNEDDPDWLSGMPHAVGLKRPNAWGLYDMHGNVREWCIDNHAEPPQTNADGTPFVDPSGPASPAPSATGVIEAVKVLRNGDFGTAESYCQSGFHTGIAWSSNMAGYGYRLKCAAKACK